MWTNIELGEDLGPLEKFNSGGHEGQRIVTFYGDGCLIQFKLKNPATVGEGWMSPVARESLM